MPDDDAHAPTPARGSARALALSALLGGALGEGAVAALAALAAQRRAWVAACAFAAATAVVLAGGVLPAVALSFLADRPRGRRLVRALVEALAEGRGAIALTLGALGLGVTLAVGAATGTLLAARMTARFAALGTAGTTAVVGGCLLLIGPEVGHAIARLVPPPRSARVARRREGGVLLLLAVALGVGVAHALSLELALPPACALVAAGASRAFAGRREGAPRRGTRAGALTLSALVVATLALFGDAPRGSQRAVLYQTSYAAPLLHLTQGLADRDGDGFSAVLGGGDCDDRDPSVHPGAIDVPDDGVDQDCSGVDAHHYRPPEAPRWTLPQGAARNNVLVVLIDALRPDHVGFAGYARPTTPRLDRFREGATWFQNAYTPAPSTRFALASMFTGYDVRRLPHRNLGGNRFALLGGAATVAERLRAAGYLTTGYTISYVAQHNLGLGQGFSHWSTPWPVEQWRAVYGHAAERTTAAAEAALAATPEDGPPFFLFAHYRCTHDPYVAHAEWPFGDRPIDVYDSALAYCDQHIGDLLDAVEARGDAGRTAVFVVSDHGEVFGEHGHTYHGNSLYEPDVRVLLLAKIPGAQARTVESPVLLTDVAPTILSLAGLSPAPDMEGWTLVPAARGEAASSRPLFLFTDLVRGAVHYRASAVVDFPYKLIRDLRLSTEELYDVVDDPSESDDRAGAGGAVGARATRLAGLLDDYESFVKTHPAGVTTP